MENYSLKEVNDGTELLVEMDVKEDFQDYFNVAFPKALETVKSLSEN